MERDLISIAYTSRNDNHGGNLILRIEAAMQALSEYKTQFGLDIELVFTEWNPPPKTPYLYDVIKVPSNIPIRWYVVPNKIHKWFINYPYFGLWHHKGQNVGMRRAKGGWLLNTSHDILFSEGLAQFLANEDMLMTNCFYRTSRIDCLIDYTEQSTQERIEHMKTRIVLEKRHNNRGIFTKASGDFILMTRERWFKLQGYTEWDIDGMYSDGLLLYRATALGMTQVVIPSVMYHMEHPSCRGAKRFATRPHMRHKYYKKLCGQMLKDREPIWVNTKEWGLADCEERQIRENVWELVGGKPPHIIPCADRGGPGRVQPKR